MIRRCAQSVYSEKCRSWYKMGKEEGRVVALWPGERDYLEVHFYTRLKLNDGIQDHVCMRCEH